MELKTREQIDPRYQWKLEHIYENDAAWEADFNRVSALLDDYKKLEGTTAENPREVIRRLFSLYEEFSPVAIYAMLRREANNNDPEAQALASRMSVLYVKMSTSTAFVQPELLAMDTDALQALMDDPEMADYSEFMSDLLRSKPHTLSKAEENLMSLYGDLESAPDTIYSALTSADMRFPDVVLADGTHEPLTEGNFGHYRNSSNPEERRQSFENIMNTYGSFGTAIAAMYSANCRKDLINARARHYSSCRAAAMEPLQIPESVYDNLISVVHESLPILTDYLKVRKTLMNTDELHMYDLYVPIVSDFHMHLPFEEAFELVKEGLKPLGEDYQELLQKAHDGGWMDVYPVQGKSSGAFSCGDLGKIHPFILLNHTDELDSAFTMAHELGHAMHSWYSNHTQPSPKTNYSLFVAEVASICNEMLMMRTLLNRFTEPKAKAYLLNYLMEQFRTTCFRQTMFAEFEMKAHRMAENGDPITADTLKSLYMDLNQQYYGSVCHVDEWIANEWMRIPHFYRSYYVYVYATGLCAAVAISARILKEGEPAVADYKRFLSSGCSLSPLEALKVAGIDMSQPEPIRQAMEVFADALKDFRSAMGINE